MINYKFIVLLIFLLIRIFAYNQTPDYVIDSLNKGANYAIEDQNFKKALEIWEKYKDEIEEDTLKIKVYLNIGASYVYYDNSNKAMSYLKEALELSKKNNDFQYKRASKLLASIYFVLKNYEACLQHLKPYITKSDNDIANTDFIIDYYNTICCYAELKQNDSLNSYINHFNKIISKTDTSLLALNDKKLVKLIQYTQVNTVNHNYKKALTIINEGLEDGTFKDLFFFNIEKAILFKKINNYDSAIFYFAQAKKNTINIADTILLYKELYNLYKENNETEKQKEIAIKIHEIEGEENLKLDYQLYNEIMDLLSSTQSESKSKNRYIYVIFFFLLISTIVFYWRYKNKTKEQLDRNLGNNTKEIFLTQIIEERIEGTLISLKEKKLFLNPDFNLNTLQQLSTINRKYLTAYFNKKEVSFIEYLNKLRIEYAIKRENNEQDTFGKYTMENKSKECGYKSVTTYRKWYNKFSDSIKF